MNTEVESVMVLKKSCYEFEIAYTTECIKFDINYSYTRFGEVL